MERARTFMSAIGTVCLIVMAIESVRQTDLSRTVVKWIGEHKAVEKQYRSQGELLLRQVKQLQKEDK